MPLNPFGLVNVAGTLPAGTEFPGTPQALLEMIEQYLLINGGADFTTINFGPDTPGASYRAYPWFKTTSGGAPIGWYSWNGSTWQIMPLATASGNTASRPTGVEGLTYFDTDIFALLIYERSQWRTAAGTPGDIKFVRSVYNGGVGIADPTIAQVVIANPGWEEFTPMRGRLIGGAGEGSGLTPRTNGEELGAEEHAITEAELPAHTHTVAGSQNMQADGNAPDGGGILAASASTDSGSTGGGDAMSLMPPVKFCWCIWKL